MSPSGSNFDHRHFAAHDVVALNSSSFKRSTLFQCGVYFRSPEEVEEEIRVRGNQHKLVYNPENPNRISRIATGTTVVLREAYFRSLLGEMRQKTIGASIPSKRFEGLPP